MSINREITERKAIHSVLLADVEKKIQTDWHGAIGLREVLSTYFSRCGSISYVRIPGGYAVRRAPSTEHY